jgi:cytochrome c556
MKFAKALLISATLFTGAAQAQDIEPTDPNAIAREAVMKMIGQNIEASFMEQGAADPASAAKPEIWANWDDFLVKATALSDAAGALDVASVETIGAGMGALGGACKDCHTTYRVAK